VQKSKILLVEDDELASGIILEFLEACDFEVISVFTVTDGIAELNHQHFDLVILDINLPDFNGFEILKYIKHHIALPVIVTSAYSDTKLKLKAFKYGASDYMVKPLDLEELEARIWVQLGKQCAIQIDEKHPDFELLNESIFFKGHILDLTTIEFEILAYFITYKNTTVSRETLIDTLSSAGTHRSLDNHIKNIRKRIGDTGKKAIYLKTEYGVGYKLVFR